MLFALVGLQLPTIVDRLSGRSTAELVGWAALVSGAVVGARILWLLLTSYLPHLVSSWMRERDPAPSLGAKIVLCRD